MMRHAVLLIGLLGLVRTTDASVISRAGGDTLRVIFTPDHTKEELMRIKDEVGAMGIKLDYWELKFDESGKLAVIRFHVADGSGHSGSAGTDDLVKNAPFGFRIDGSKGARKPVRTGCLK